MKREAAVPRIYEYVAADGTTYWSFTQHLSMVSPPKRLVLQSRKGIVLPAFLVQLKQIGAALARGPIEEPVEETG